MKVYFVVKEPSERTINHFVSSLGNALQKQGCEVVYGWERLWTDDVLECDIVHFQWPEFIFGSDRKHISDEEVERLRLRLVLLREKEIKVFLQIHNLKPHGNQDKNVLRLYELLYQHADVMVHMGKYSRDLLQPQYPNAQHVVIPHHIYDEIYSFDYTREEARERLHIPLDRQVVLSFGKFRNEQERNFILSLKNKCSSWPPAPLKGEKATECATTPTHRTATNTLVTKEKATECATTPPLGGRGANSPIFLMPGFYRESLHTWNPKKLVTRLYHTLCYRLKGIKFCNEVIPSDLMQCYFCAADVVLLQRLDILNSGNLPMAFAAGKVVVGPNVGNVGQILNETGNFTFDPHDIKSAESALQKALTETTKGKENKTYATEHWSSDLIATTLLKYYQQLK